MLHTDFHTHTTFCDGKSTPREMVEAAYRMGMTDLGVSGHADFSMFEPGFGMDDEKLRQYTEELQELREEYRGKMNLYIGIELDGLGPVQKAEYAIGSTHALIKDGGYVCVDDTEEKLVKAVETLWHGDWYAFAREYFEAEAQIYDRTKCDFIGHFDLLTKFNEGYKHFDETKDAYLEPAITAMHKLAALGIPFEINTGAMSRGYRSAPYPSAALLNELCACGGRILINSDSHSAYTIGYGFKQAQELAVACGFKSVCALNPGGGFREILLV